MFRITVHDAPAVATIRVEGILSGPAARELKHCCQNALLLQGKPILRVDLTGVVGVDREGIGCLEALHGQGAQFVTADCVMKDIVDQLAKSAEQ